MSKLSLRQTAYQYLKLSRQGKYQTRKYKHYVIHKMVDDLFKTGHAPRTWQLLASEHVERLVRYWKMQGLSTSTMMGYMTIIRSFIADLNCQISGIDNQSLQLVREYSSRKKRKGNVATWRLLSEPTSALIMALQIEFGLTFSEAIRLLPKVHTNDERLWITREIAFNSQDRVIPIRDETQKKVISDLEAMIGDRVENLAQFEGYDLIRMKWRKTLAKHRLPSNKSWRYLYARALYPTLSHAHGAQMARKLLQDEMGIQSRNTLWNYLNQ